MNRALHLIAILLASAGCGGGGSAGPDEARVGIEQSAIINGAQSNDTSVVEVVAGGKVCSGTYVGSGLVLTASHCLNDDPGSLDYISVNFIDYDNPANEKTGIPAVSSSALPQVDKVMRDDTNDLAVILVDHCAVPPTSALPFILDPGSDALTGSDVGLQVDIAGFGDTVAGDPTTAGIRHDGTATISNVGPLVTTVHPAKAVPCEGDSGGPMFLVRNGKRYVAGVHSTGDCSTNGTYTRLDSGDNATFLQTPAEVALLSALSGCGGGGGTGGPRCAMGTGPSPDRSALAASAFALVLVLARRKRRPVRGLPLALVLALAAMPMAGACSASNAPEQDCLDMADAYAKAVVRCMQGNYQSANDLFVEGVAAGSCANVASVRDDGSLRGICVPSFDTISCADLSAGKFDPSCNQQLLHQPSPPDATFDAGAVQPN